MSATDWQHLGCCPLPCLHGVPEEDRLPAFAALVEAACEAIDSHARMEYGPGRSGLPMNVVANASRLWRHLGDTACTFPDDFERSEATGLWLMFTSLLEEHLSGMLLLGTHGNLFETYRARMLGDAA